MAINVNTNKRITNGTSFTGAPSKLYTIKNERAQRVIEKIGEYSSPHSRLILGITALMTQPFIDWQNKDVDKDTRRVSTARTIGKIIAGTISGVIVRAGCIALIKKLTDANANKKWQKLLIPTNVSSNEYKNAERLLKKHRGAIGTIVALFVMLFTNFAFDVPVTKFLTNFLNDKFKKNGNKQQTKERGNL